MKGRNKKIGRGNVPRKGKEKKKKKKERRKKLAEATCPGTTRNLGLGDVLKTSLKTQKTSL